MTGHLRAYGFAAGAGCAALVVSLLVPAWSCGEAARRVLPLFQAHPWLYWLLGYAAVAALLVQVLRPAVFPSLANRTASRTSRAAFVLLAVATVWLLRWPALAHFEMNPDESADIAGALTLTSDPRYWVSVDGGSHGPVVEFALLPARLLALRLDYGAARLVGLGMMLGSIFFLFGTLRGFFPEAISRVAVAPLVLCVAFQTNGDFLAYNAEHPTIFLLCAGAFGCARLAVCSVEGVRWRALATGLALGLVPFSKQQGVPPALVLAALALVVLFVRFRGQWRQQRVACAILCAGGLAPAALLVLYLWQQGLFFHFWTSYIKSNLAYAGRFGMTLTEKFLFFLEWTAKAPIGELFFPYFAGAAGAGLLLVGVLRLDRTCHWLLLAGGAVLLASVYTVVLAAAMPYPHYLLFLVFPLAFVAAVVLAALHETQFGRVGQLVLVSIWLAAAVALPSAKARAVGNYLVTTTPDEPLGLAVADLIRQYATPNDPLVVWGWMDRYYVLTGMRQGTLHANSSVTLMDPDYCFPLYLRQFERAQPPVFVDAVGLTSFEYDEREKLGHESRPDFQELIADEYELVGEIYGTRVYVSKKRLAELPVLPPLPVEVPFRAAPAVLHQATWKAGIAECKGEIPFLAYVLKKREFIEAIRLKFSYDVTEGPILFQLSWGEAGQEESTELDQVFDLALVHGKGPTTLTIPVKDTINAFWIRLLGKSCVFKLEEIVLLYRPREQPRPHRQPGTVGR